MNCCLVPIVVFAYNRPEHLKKALTSLAMCSEAKNCEVFIFIDGPKKENGKEINLRVEKVARSFDKNYFSSVTIENSEYNKGLAKSIVYGVDKIIKQFGKVIVIEDDVEVSPYFISFMNSALSYYQENERIWSVGGYIAPIKLPNNYEKDYIVTQRVSSTAWGIWQDRWELIDWSIQNYISFRKNLIKRARFNKWGKDRSVMLDDQMQSVIDSWAIRFDYAMYENNMYNIVPRKSLVHITFDGDGTHDKMYCNENEKYNVDLAERLTEYHFDEPIVSEKIRMEFNKFYKLPLLFRAKKYLERSFKIK